MKEKKHLLKLLFGTTLCIVMLLGIVLSVPGYTAHAEEEKEELFYTFSEELDKTETSAVPFSLFGAMDGSVELSGTNEEKWINRLDLTGEAGITLEMYNSLVEASDNDGSLDYLIEDQYYTDGEASFTMITVTGELRLEDENSDYNVALSNIAGEVAADYTPFIRAAFDAFDRDHPEVFWLDGATAYTTTASATGNQTGGYDYVIKIDLLLKGTTNSGAFDIRADIYRSESAIKAAITSMQADRTAILGGITADMGTVDKIKFFNEKLTKTNEYNTKDDLSSESIGHDARECVSALEGRYGDNGPVCEGYARAFKVLCDEAKIPCVLVDGQATNSSGSSEAHMWNYVKVDGSWYAVDVTWNDPKVVLANGDPATAPESGYEGEDWLLLGSDSTQENGTMTFLESHPVANQVSGGGVGFTNGPVLATDAYASCTNHTYTDGTCVCGDIGYTYDATTNTYNVYKAGAMQAAIDAAEVSGTAESPAIIKLMADLDLPGVASNPNYPEYKDYGVLIDAGVIIIDLNGYTLNSVDGANTLQIGAVWGEICDAKVTITDSSDTGVVRNANSCAISNCGGELIINKGTIETDDKNGTSLYGIGNQEGTVIINDGKISVLVEGQVVFAKAVKSNGSNAAVIMKGGMISAVGYNCDGIEIMAGTCTITGGTITADGWALEIRSDVEISITGGSFEGGRSDIEAASGVIQVLGVDKNGGKGATFPDGITVANNTLKNILAEGAGFYDANGNLLTVADGDTSITGTVTVGCANHTGGTATCVSGKTCEICGSEYGERDASNHGEMNAATGKCDSCGNFLAAASVTTGESTTYYTDFANALENWTDGTTLTLLKDAAYGTTDNDILYILNKSVTLDLNGHTLNLSGRKTIQVGESENASGTLTILDSGVNGTLKAVGNSVVVYGNCNIQGGNLIGRVYVMSTATLNMTGGSITTDNTTLSYEAVWNDGKFHISGGKLNATDRGIANVGTLTITGSPTIIGNGGAAVWNTEQGNVTISGTPTFSSSSYELYIRKKITLNTQPADGTTWKVSIDTRSITNGVFAIPGEGVTLEASKFTSALDGYDVGWNAKGELLLCNHTEQAAVSNGNGTHNTTCYCGKTTYETNVACSGGVATDTSQAYCEYCNAPYGELNPDVHYDIVAANMTAEQLQSALTELLNAGETDILIVLAAKADEEMFTAINTALRSSIAADGSINLTIAGVKTIPHSALGNGLSEESLNTDPHELKTLTLPDAVTLEMRAMSAPKLEAVYAPKVTEWNTRAVRNNYEALNTIVLSAPGTITANFTDLNTENIDLVLNCDKKNDVTDGTTWQGETWKAITFMHSWTNGTCTACSTTCDHSGSTHEKATDKGDGTHSITCSVCGSIETEDHDFSYDANNNVITASCNKCETTGTATITAENVTYTSFAYTNARVSYSDNWPGSKDLTIVFKQEETILDTAPVNDGDYTAYLEYAGAEVSAYFTIAKADAAVATAPTAVTGLTYTGSAQGLVNEGTATDGTMQYSLEENGTYSETIPAGTNAGDYIVWYKVVGDQNHNDTAPASVAVTIAPKSLEGAEVGFANCYYSGDVTHSPVIRYIELDGINLSSDDYSMEECEKKNVGTYDVAISGKGNFIGTITAQWSISKNGFTSVDGLMLVIEEEPYDVSVLTKNYDGNGEFDTSNAIYISGVNEEANQSLVLDEGFSVIVRTADAAVGEGKTLVADITILGDMQQNLNQTEYTNIPVVGITGTITKAPQNISAENLSLIYGDTAAAITVTGAKTALSYEVVESSSDNETVVTVDENGLVSIVNLGTAKIKITAASSDNYESAECEITVTVSKAHSMITVDGEDLTVSASSAYAGETVTVTWNVDAAYVDDYQLELSVQGASGTEVPVTSVTGADIPDNVLKYTFVMPAESVDVIATAYEMVYSDTENRPIMDAAAVPVIDFINETIGTSAENVEYSTDITMNVVWNAVTGPLTAEPGACLWFRTKGSLTGGVFTPASACEEIRIPTRPDSLVFAETVTETAMVIGVVDEKYAGTTMYGVLLSGAAEEDIIWQTSNEFTGLQPNTYYLLYLKIEAKAGEYFAFGPVYVLETTLQAVPTVSEVTATGTYGNSLSAIGISGKANFNGTAVDGYFMWEADNADELVPEAGTYTGFTAKFCVNNSMYADVAGIPVTLVINKAAMAPDMPSDIMNVSYETETVNSITLPNGWVWAEEDASMSLTPGKAVTATAVYNGLDKGNYVIETVSIAITRSACIHTDENTDHICDNGCGIAQGTCADSTGDGDHVCDYGCGKTLTECSDGTVIDGICDECGLVLVKHYTITVNVNPAASGTASSSALKAPAGATINLTATPLAGYLFQTWRSSEVTFIVNSFVMPEKDVTVEAVFVTVTPIPTVAPTVTVTPVPTVTVTPIPTAAPATPTVAPTVTVTPIPTVAPTTPTPVPTTPPYIPPYNPPVIIWPTATPVPTAIPSPTPTSTPIPSPTATPVPTHNPEETWVTGEAATEYKEAEKQYDVLLGTSKKDASMVETLEVGKSIDLNFYGVKNWKKNAYTYKWTSSDESVAVVDSAGVVTMLDEGIAIISLELVYKATGEKLSVAPMLVGVPEAVYDVFLGTSAKNADILRKLTSGEKVDLNFYGVKNWKRNDYTYEWTSTNEEVATVSNSGLVNAKEPGVTIIRLKLKKKSTGEYLMVAPVVLTVQEKTEE